MGCTKAELREGRDDWSLRTDGNAAGRCWAVLWDTGLGSRAYPAVVSRGTASPVGLSGMGNPVPGFVEDSTA